METVLWLGSGRATRIYEIGTYFITLVVSKCVYFISKKNDILKAYIELDEEILSVDIFNCSKLFLLCSTCNKQLYAVEADFLFSGSVTESSDDDYILLEPVNRKAVLTLTSVFTIVTCDSVKRNIWLLEYLENGDGRLSCYDLSVCSDEFNFQLLWLMPFSGCSSSGYDHFHSAVNLLKSNSYLVVSISTETVLNLSNESSFQSDKRLVISDALFNRLFGSRLNFENQVVILLCLPTGTVQWFPRKSMNPSPAMVLWDMQEEVVCIKRLLLSDALIKSGVENVAAHENCLVIVGSSGFIVVLRSLDESHIKIQICSLIDSCDLHQRSLVFSTSNGIYKFDEWISLIGNGDEKDKVFPVKPKLLLNYKTSLIKFVHDETNKDQIKTWALLKDGRIAKFFISFSSLTSKTFADPTIQDKPKTATSLLSSIDIIMKKINDVNLSNDSLNIDFDNLCLAGEIFQNFLKKDVLSSFPGATASMICCNDGLEKTFMSARVELLCLSKDENLFKIGIIFQFLGDLMTDKNTWSCLVNLKFANYGKNFSEGKSKRVPVERGIPICKSEVTTCECSVCFIQSITLECFPIIVAAFAVCSFSSSNELEPLSIPIDLFELGPLEFVTTPWSMLGPTDSSSTPREYVVTNPKSVKGESHNVTLFISKTEACPEKLNSCEIWKMLFESNKNVFFNNLETCKKLNLNFLQNFHIELEIRLKSEVEMEVHVDCSSLKVLALIHRELSSIFHKAGLYKPSEGAIVHSFELESVNASRSSVKAKKCHQGDVSNNYDHVEDLEFKRLVDLYKRFRC